MLKIKWEEGSKQMQALQLKYDQQVHACPSLWPSLTLSIRFSRAHEC